MKKLFIILLLLPVILMPEYEYAQIFTGTGESVIKPSGKSDIPSFSSVFRENAELEISAVQAGISVSRNSLQKYTAGFSSTLICSSAYPYFKDENKRLPEQLISPAYLNCIYPFHSYW